MLNELYDEPDGFEVHEVLLTRLGCKPKAPRRRRRRVLPQAERANPEESVVARTTCTTALASRDVGEEAFEGL